MASWFPPPRLDSGERANDTCDTRGFLVYCNSILPAEHRLQHWSQHLNLAVAGVGIGIPLLLLIGNFVVYLARRLLRKRTGPKSSSPSKRDCSQSSLELLESFKSLKSYRLRPAIPGSSSHDAKANCSYDLRVVDIWSVEECRHSSPERCEAKSLATETIAGVELGYVDLDMLRYGAVLEPSQKDVTDLLANLFHASSAQALVLRPFPPKGDDDIEIDQFNLLLEQLVGKEIPVLAICQHDDPALSTLDLGLVDGLVVENALILRNGQRRDFFRSVQLRRVVAGVAEQKLKRPSFFFAILDLWDVQPSPAVVRRAFKLSEHFGAHFEHGYTRSAPTSTVAPKSLSGFEYLRRDEPLELQKTWIEQEKKVFVGKTAEGVGLDVAELDMEELVNVLPDARKLLKPQPLSEHLLALQSESPRLVDPPRYADFLPRIQDFWEVSFENEPFSKLGCFPVIAGASPQDFENVVQTQTHLRDLNMLEQLRDSEVEQIIQQLQAFRRSTQFSQALEALIDSLTSRTTAIFRGLATGFQVADSAAHFWGVSSTNENCLDIFVSKTSPSEVATILHVWLAANGVPRVLRFEEEARLDKLIVSEWKPPKNIPVSIRAEMELATPSELLSLMQRLRLVTESHPLTKAMQDFSEHVLLERASNLAWTAAHSRKLWEGEVDMRKLFCTRLEEFARSGASELPTLDNLLRLHEQADCLMQQSLFTGDRDALNTLTTALLHAHDPWNSWTEEARYVDVNADLFALIYFTALRKAALEDVYIEATDRCPFFLSQPDQAAVFSELWSVGSQCYGYFGIFPRDLGRLVYDRYQLHLRAHPPPAHFEGGALMTCYASPAELLEAKQARAAERKELATLPASDGYGKTFVRWGTKVQEFGALSIFCLPAIIDVLLLTFLGRGLFVTAFMGIDFIEMGGYALLISLLLAAGVTGLVGSTGNYYLCHVSCRPLFSDKNSLL
jgi:hypothetical protein